MSDMVKFELNREGVAELMKCAEMQQGIYAMADEVVARCGEGVEAEKIVGKTRCSAKIRTVTPKAYYSNLKHNTILKAVQG